MRKLFAIILVLATLVGCAPIVPLSTIPLAASTPTPSPSNYAPQQFNAMLYFVGDSHQLVPLQRVIEVTSDQSAASAIVRELIQGPGDQAPALMPIMPADAQLLGVELTGNIVTVNIGSERWDPIGFEASTHEEEYLTLCMAVANTLTGLPGIHYVTVLINSYPLRYYFLPIGPMTNGSVDIDAEKYARENEGRRTRGAVQDQAIYTANSQLYFSDRSGRYLIPEVREVNYYQFDLIGLCNAILREILRGPDDLLALQRLLPNRPDWFAMTPALTTSTTSIDQIVELSFSPELFTWFEEQGIDPILAVGSLSLSLLTYCPDLVGVGCSFPYGMVDAWLARDKAAPADAPTPISTASSAGQGFEKRLMLRRDYEPVIGASFLLYFPVSDHYLKPVLRAFTIHHEQAEPLLWMQELVKGPSQETLEGIGVRPAFPESVLGAPDYIRDVVLDGSTAVVILDQGLQAHCRDMTPEQERLMIYAMVNTLTERSDISWVRFILPDGTAPVFSGHIDLSGPLMRAPLLIRH